MLQLDEEVLRILIRTALREMRVRKDWDLQLVDLKGKWNSIRIILDTYKNANFEFYVNNQLVRKSKVEYFIPDCAPSVEFKIGIYRPYRYYDEPSTTSIIDYDKIVVKKLK